MIEIKNRDTGRTVETICNDDEFKTDSLYLYSKDEFNNDIQWRRDYFVAVKKIN